MKRKKITLIFIFMAMIVCVFLLWSFTQGQEIERSINAKVYYNGLPVGETEILIDGKLTKRIFDNAEMRFVGEFVVGDAGLIGNRNTQARIIWGKDGKQSILFFYEGDFISLDVRSIMIDEDMNCVAMSFSNGYVVATTSDLALQIQKNEGE